MRLLREAASSAGTATRATSLAHAPRLLALGTALRPLAESQLVIVPDDRTARQLEEELLSLLDSDTEGTSVARIPALDADPYRGLAAHASLATRRVAALDRLVNGPPVVAIVSAPALLVPVPCAATIREWSSRIEVGERLDIDAVMRRAVRAGYRVIDVVGAPGEIARRGGLFDVWPPNEPHPLRVELFGDEVDSVRRFDAATQRTIEAARGFRILPAREAPLDAAVADALLDALIGPARAVLERDHEREGGALADRLAGFEAAPRLFRDDLVALEDLLSSPPILWEPESVLAEIARAFEERVAAHAESPSVVALPPPHELFESPDSIAVRLARAPLAISELPLAGDGRRLVDLRGRPPAIRTPVIETLATTIGPALAIPRPVVLLARGEGRRERLQELLHDEDLPARLASDDDPSPPEPGEIVIAAGSLALSCEIGTDGALILAEADLFGPEPVAPPKRRRREEAFVSDLRDLKPGDLLVHVDHGIGRYAGLERRPATGEELLVLEYAAGDRLFVPVSRLDLVQKYSAGERPVVPLDKLGGPGWSRRRSRVKKAVESIAGELLNLYARRQAVRAQVFASETPWQREFESAFPHQLTADQVAALGEVKGDLRSGRPMDRLLCGDVGYGKTEVAMRAAFRVIQEGHQVAVLVPTTVLAFQHLVTFRARMAAWPVRIEMISRFASTTEANERIAATKRGEVDILIGTHRLLSKDVGFKRLGLLIVDEEQRFGVKHKEAIKKMSLGVHVLSMSATPIPRTLQLSLAGVRDLSVIETPPRNRLAIQTHLVPWSSTTIAAAVRNEIKRGGQVYFVHPRVEDIEQIAASIREWVPEASIRHGHGQMPEHRLEEVMLSFVRGETDVLVATTIIENGLDIPRANTIVVNEAHRFGLSQLYQMRGRVGRSDVRAYAYLLVPPARELTAEARQRLSALVEFSDLGAGFRIAALDLEIRGAGEFLGARQSGHIAAVGFELYAEMLEKEVRRQRGEPLEHAPEPVTINLGVPSFLPEELVPEPGQRLAFYKRLAAADDPERVDALVAEAEDRYGKLPEPAQNLFRLARLRLAAAAQGAISIDWMTDGVAVKYGERPKVDADKIFRLMHEDDGVRLTPGGVIRLRVPDAGADRIAAASLALRRLAL